VVVVTDTDGHVDGGAASRGIEFRRRPSGALSAGSQRRRAPRTELYH